VYEILLRKDLVPNVHLFKIVAPAVASKPQKVRVDRIEQMTWISR
jgi:hypothetical protein